MNTYNSRGVVRGGAEGFKPSVSFQDPRFSVRKEKNSSKKYRVDIREKDQYI